MKLEYGRTKSVTKGKENYENVVYLDFRKNAKIHKAFEGDYNIDEIILFLSTCDSSFRFIPEKTLIIFDEVQDCNNARSSLKYFQIDGRFDVICTGSMLGIKGYNRKKDKRLAMKPKPITNFQEFENQSVNISSINSQCEKDNL